LPTLRGFNCILYQLIYDAFQAANPMLVAVLLLVVNAFEPDEYTLRHTTLLFRLAELPLRDEHGDRSLRRCGKSPACGPRPPRGHHFLRVVAARL
jgi:hypothetical protein